MSDGAEFIDREVAKKVMSRFLGYLDADMIERLQIAIQKIPAVYSSEEKAGTWLHEELVPDDVTGHVMAECSNCHATRIVDNYCPNRGAKMR